MNKLILENIRYKAENTQILEKINLTAEAGKVTAILGPSGSGKSTLLKLVAGIIEADSGKIIYNKRNIAGTPSGHRKIGYVSQNPSLLPYLCIWQNITLGISDYPVRRQKEIALSLLRDVGLSKYAYLYPNQLSVGQQQKISILRAIASKANIFLFDEPYANLDVINKDALIKQSIDMLKGTNAIKILVTHNPYEAMVAADHIYVLNDGQIIQSGSPKDLYEKPNNEFVARLFGLANILEVSVKASKATTSLGELKIPGKKSGKAKIVVRPDKIKISKRSLKGFIPAKIKEKRFYYGKFCYMLKPVDSNSLVRVISRSDYNVGDIAYLQVNELMVIA